MTFTLTPTWSSPKAVRGWEKLSQSYGHQRVAAFAPRVEPTLQWADTANPLFPQQERHTGARRFVGSSTVQDDVAIAWQLIIFLSKILGIHPERARYRLGIRLEVDGMPQVDDHHFLAGIQLLLKLFDTDSRNAQFAKKPLPRDDFVTDVQSQCTEQQNKQSSAQMRRMLRHPLDFPAEDETRAQIRGGPQQRATSVEQQKSSEPHVENSRQRRSDGAQPRNKFRD